MLCRCGHDLGEVTDQTRGVCPSCERSIWMQCAMLKRPDSEAIARELNYSNAKSCACTDWKTACFGFCGVRLVESDWTDGSGKTQRRALWVAITPERRLEWFERVMAITENERKARKVRNDAAVIRAGDDWLKRVLRDG